MALAGRSPRRDGGRRLLAFGIIITLIVVIIDASMKSRSPTAASRLAASVWVDRVLPIIEASSTQGRVIDQIRNMSGISSTSGVSGSTSTSIPGAITSGSTSSGSTDAGSSVSATSIMSELNQTAAAAKRTYAQLEALRPPDSLAGAAGLLQASLLVRSQGTAMMAQAIDKALAQSASLVPAGTTTTSTVAGPIGSTTSTTAGSTASTSTVPEVTSAQLANDPQVNALVTAGQDFQISDRAYQLFAQRLPAVGVTAPVSSWAADPNQYQQASLQVFLADLVNTASGQPVHQVVIAAVTLNPSPLNVQGGVEVLVPTKVVSVSVVVKDTGTERENNLAVQVSINPSAGNAVFQEIISPDAGTAFNAQLGPLNPKPGAVTTMTITVTPPTGSTTPQVTQTVTFMTVMPSSTTTGTGGAG